MIQILIIMVRVLKNTVRLSNTYETRAIPGQVRAIKRGVRAIISCIHAIIYITRAINSIYLFYHYREHSNEEIRIGV
ncbi:Uncharacterised protein [Bacillus freudenreichii]|nr:Uncharacterised protein [Bacillus freudenreichii]